MKIINLNTLIVSALVTAVIFIAPLSVPTVLILAISAFIFHLICKISMEIYKQVAYLITENVELRDQIKELTYLLDKEMRHNIEHKKQINYLINKYSL